MAIRHIYNLRLVNGKYNILYSKHGLNFHIQNRVTSSDTRTIKHWLHRNNECYRVELVPPF